MTSRVRVHIEKSSQRGEVPWALWLTGVHRRARKWHQRKLHRQPRLARNPALSQGDQTHPFIFLEAVVVCSGPGPRCEGAIDQHSQCPFCPQ
jgi:hypothetical protein